MYKRREDLERRETKKRESLILSSDTQARLYKKVRHI